MSVEEKKEFVRNLYEEVFNRRNLEWIERAATPDFVDHDPTNPAGNLQGVKAWFTSILEAFPDLKITIDDILAEGEEVVVRYRTTGTHSAPFLGVPATGRQIAGTGIDILRFEGDKIAEHWGEYDNLGLMQQLGIVPEQLQAPLAPPV